jgi:hypothetical protein
VTLRDQLQTSLGSSVTIEHELGGGGMSRVFVAGDTALAQLRQAHSKGQRKETWHYIAAHDSLHGYPPFDELVRPRR